MIIIIIIVHIHTHTYILVYTNRMSIHHKRILRTKKNKYIRRERKRDWSRFSTFTKIQKSNSLPSSLSFNPTKQIKNLTKLNLKPCVFYTKYQLNQCEFLIVVLRIVDDNMYMFVCLFAISSGSSSVWFGPKSFIYTTIYPSSFKQNKKTAATAK